MSGAELKLAEVFAVLKPDLSVETGRVTPTIYGELDARFDRFQHRVLVSEYEFSASWPTWARHPAGDEPVALLSGQAEVVMRKHGENECVSLVEPGAFVVVPAGAWHTARTSAATRMCLSHPASGLIIVPRSERYA